MKKLFPSIVAISSIFLLTGCGDNPEEDTSVSIEEEDVVMTQQDLVVEGTAAPAPAPVPGTPTPPVPGASTAPPVPGAPQAATSANDPTAFMTPFEKEEYKREQDEMKEAVEAETANFSIIENDVQAAVEAYYTDYNKLPANLADLVKGEYLSSIPRLPAGKSLRIDGKTLEVKVE